MRRRDVHMATNIYSPTKGKPHLTCFNNIFSNNEFISIGLLFSLPVHTYLLTCETGYWSIFIYVYMRGCAKCHVYFSTFVFANESWFCLCRVLSFIFYWFGMVLRKLTIPERWQAVGMHSDGFSNRSVADHFRVNHSISVRLVQRFRQTGNVTDRRRASRPRQATPREDRIISRRAWQRLFSTVGALRGNLTFGGHISTHTVIRRLHHQGMRARWPIKRPQLTLRHRHARFDWSHDNLGWTIRTWRRVHWSDESRFLLHSTDGRARVWRQRNTSFQDNHILGTTAFEGGGVTVWDCSPFDCNLDLYVLDGNRTGQKYRDNVLAPRIVPHFDNPASGYRLMFMDDNARPHRARIVYFLQQEAVQTITWPAMSPDMKHIEHVWDFIGRKINQRNPKCQNVDELITAVLCEAWWGVLQNFTISAVDILVINFDNLHIRTIDAFKGS
jgi:transposase